MQIVNKPNYKLPPGIRKVLLIQLGDIGDVVWTIPSIGAVKNSLPGSEVSILVKEGFGGILEADPAIAKIFEVKKHRGNVLRQLSGHLSFLKEIRAQHFDLVVDLRLGDRGAFLSLATGAPLRVSMHHPPSVPFWRKYLFTHCVLPIDAARTQGAADQSLRILRAIGIDSHNIIPQLWVSAAVKKRVREELIEKKADGLEHWITINPFSRWPYKEWHDRKWVEILNWLWRDYAIPAIIVGSREERPKAEALIRQSEARAFNFAGLTTLQELAGLLSMSRLHIGVDSAAPHIAASTGAPTITIYGPSSWQDWAPLGKDHRVVVSKLDCVPCRRKGCDNSGRSRCLEELSTDQVKNALREAIDIYWPKTQSKGTN